MAVEHSITQRIRYGLTGLAMVFLVVLLGAALRRVGQDEASRPAAVAPANPNEPLAEIGAAPGQGEGNDAAETPDPAKKTRR